MGGSVIGLMIAMSGLRVAGGIVALALMSSGAVAFSKPPPCFDQPAAAAQAVRDALYDGDGAALAALVHREAGVRVSPAAFVDPEVDRVLDPDEARRLWSDDTVHLWGYAEATGAPIKKTGADFIADYVTVLPFDTVETRPHDPGASPASTVDNATKVYPGAAIVEFPVGKGPEDWAVLRLAFASEGGCQRLVGLIRARWSP